MNEKKKWPGFNWHRVGQSGGLTAGSGVAEQTRQFVSRAFHRNRHFGNAFLGESQRGGRDADGAHACPRRIVNRRGEAAHAKIKFLVVETETSLAGEFGF